VTPIAVVARVDALLGVIKPDAFEPELAPKVLSSVIVPGNTIELDAIDPGIDISPSRFAM
jgi:hypothetical protein